jgi:hypothetical protein
MFIQVIAIEYKSKIAKFKRKLKTLMILKAQPRSKDFHLSNFDFLPSKFGDLGPSFQEKKNLRKSCIWFLKKLLTICLCKNTKKCNTHVQNKWLIVIL